MSESLIEKVRNIINGKFDEKIIDELNSLCMLAISNNQDIKLTAANVSRLIFNQDGKIKVQCIDGIPYDIGHITINNQRSVSIDPIALLGKPATPNNEEQNQRLIEQMQEKIRRIVVTMLCQPATLYVECSRS